MPLKNTQIFFDVIDVLKISTTLLYSFPEAYREDPANCLCLASGKPPWRVNLQELSQAWGEG